MSKITVQIGFYLQGEHYAQMEAFLPKIEAQKIPLLKIQQRITQNLLQQPKAKRGPGRIAKTQLSKSQKGSSKKIESEEQQIQDEQENINEMQNQQQDEEDQIMDEEQIDQEKIDSQKQQENLMRYLEQDEDSDDDDLEDEDEDLSSLSRSMSVIRSNHKTKRQKGEKTGLMELPDRRPRKDKKFDQATQMIRRQEKQRKRKQYLKKQVEAQEKATLDKILNQTGRKLKMREEKQNQEEKRKQQKMFKNLGETPKITLIDNIQGSTIFLHKTNLFSEQMTKAPEIKPKNRCTKCGNEDGRYRIKNSQNFACSLNCYKVLV